MQKLSLSPLWYCQFHLDFQRCHGWVNLNQLKVPPGHLLPGGLPGLVPLADITKIYRNVPKLYQNIPKITPDIPKLCQDMTSCLVASLAWILLQRPRSPRASHLSELNNSQTNNILAATRHCLLMTLFILIHTNQSEHSRIAGVVASHNLNIWTKFYCWWLEVKYWIYLNPCCQL